MRDIEFNFKGITYSEAIAGNLKVGDLTPVEVREGLNTAVGKYAFYGALMAEVRQFQDKLKTEYDFWHGQKYHDLVAAPTTPAKATETWKNTKIMLQHKKEYKEWQMKLRNIQAILTKVDALRSAFKLQANTLQSVGSMLRQEIEMAGMGGGARGSRDLEDKF